MNHPDPADDDDDDDEYESNDLIFKLNCNFIQDIFCRYLFPKL